VNILDDLEFDNKFVDAFINSMSLMGIFVTEIVKFEFKISGDFLAIH
jgi:hypothetical protein